MCASIQIATLRQELQILVTKRNQLEDAYTVFATEEVGMDQESVAANIKKARSAPQKNKRLQAIHEAHKVVVSKEAAIEKAVDAVAEGIDTGRVRQVWI